MLDGLIFDIDGTLWDCTKEAAVGYNRGFATDPAIDVRVTGEDLHRLFGKPMGEIAEILLPMYEKERREALFRVCMDRELETLRELRPEPYEGVRETVRALAEHMELFIVSNCQAGYPEVFMEATGLAECFTAHFCPDDNGNSKAQNIAHVRREFGLANTCYVGDTALDEKACRESGTPFIYASYGFGEASSPDYVIRSFSELTSIAMSGR